MGARFLVVARVCTTALIVLAACGDDDGDADPMDTGPEPDRVVAPVPPPRLDAMPEASMDAGPRDTGAPDAGRDPALLDAGPGLGLPVCDPRDPAACAEGESCRALYGSRGVQFTCRFGGSVTEGEPCEFAPSGFSGEFFTDNCVGGLLCNDIGAGEGQRCISLCASNDECGAGEKCRLLFRGLPPFPFAGTCLPTVECDPSSGDGCPSGQSCRGSPDVELHWESAYCDPDGPLEEGEICFGFESCGPGLGCSIVPLAEGGFDPPDPDERYFVASRCQQLCDTAAATDSCGARTTGCVGPIENVDPSYTAGFCRLPDPDPIGLPDRPAHVIVPSSYDGSTAVPLVVALHGQTASGTSTDRMFRIRRQAERDGFLAVTPDGPVSPDGVPYWNVAPVACTEEPCPDDVAYILGLIAEMKTTYRVDADRVYVTGISNGGYMSYRLACDGADVITAIASMAGADVLDATDCTPSRPVSVLEVHGDRDSNVPYGGSPRSLGTVESVERWATRGGCDLTMATMGTPFDIDTTLEGDETTVRTYSAGCMPGIDAELWTMVGADHYFFGQLADDFFDRVMTWLLRHSR